MAVLLETTLGDLVIDLYPEERPRCTLNFLKLCKIKYFNFCLFHSIQRNFMAQAGDPTGTGEGGESLFSKLYGEQAKYFEMETNPRIKHKKKGALSMVNNGDNLHGSQFFFTLAEDLDYLDGQHTVFGEITEGLDVLEKINEAYCDKKHRPYQDIRINHTIILDDPFDDPDGLVIPDRSPEPTKEQLESGRIGADEDLKDEDGKTKEELEEEEEKKEAHANAQILEMVGDLPDADVKPPENVLFVCKLNPLTTSEDLEIIFSRFGKISSCEVIKDKVSGDSLSYAFIEFEREEDCEEAYFKMDNVLIDDRRIHVDFSQSVAKLNLGSKDPGITPTGGERPQYAIKETRSKQSKNYDLVLDDNYETPGVSSTSDHKKHRGRHASRASNDRSDHGPDRSKSKKDGRKSRKRYSSPEDSEEDRRRHKKKTKEKRDVSESSEDERRPRLKRSERRDDSDSEDDTRHKQIKKKRQRESSASSDEGDKMRKRKEEERDDRSKDRRGYRDGRNERKEEKYDRKRREDGGMKDTDRDRHRDRGRDRHESRDRPREQVREKERHRERYRDR